MPIGGFKVILISFKYIRIRDINHILEYQLLFTFPFLNRMNKLMELANLQPKRPKATKPRQVRKKRKIKDMLNIPSSTSQR